ncbi:MAG: methionyl-tRNA formyltransferase-like protein [Parcubacteria group bacterium Gr01-1014_38]|nr:MAG: methionyl-tRNA formyltransferase-like protein [Parcubacteria group bacterium Gr01-1014_38]
MSIVLLCATPRGLVVLRRLRELCPADDLTVCSFREEPWEPPYLEEIRRFSEAHGARFFETKNVSSPKAAEIWQNPIDLVLMVHWRYLVSFPLLRAVRRASVVFHDSLLPAYRGFSPTVWALVNGETRGGVSLIYVAEEVDAGDIIDQWETPLRLEETIADVLPRITEGYVQLLERNLALLWEGRAPRRSQDHSRATYTCKRTPEDNRIVWSEPTSVIWNCIRAVTRPYTGAYTWFEGKRLTVWSAQPLPTPRRYAGRIPGRVVEVRPGEGIWVLTGDGVILLRRVQLEGGPDACAADLIKSITVRLG